MEEEGWSEWVVHPDGFRERSRVTRVDPNEPEPEPEPDPLLAGHWGEERKQPDGSIKQSWVFTHPDHPANRQTGKVGDEEIKTQRVDLPGGTANRPVAGGDAELQSSGGLPVVGGEDALSATLKKLGSAPGFDAGKPWANRGHSLGKQGQTQQPQTVTGKTKVEWYRYELDFRPLKKGGYVVLIRKRLRWSDTRHVKTILKRTCPYLTKQIVGKISVGKFTPEAIVALQGGGISDGFIKALQDRIGKGNGRRRTELTDFERSLLARIESGIITANRSGNDTA